MGNGRVHPLSWLRRLRIVLGCPPFRRPPAPSFLVFSRGGLVGVAVSPSCRLPRGCPRGFPNPPRSRHESAAQAVRQGCQGRGVLGGRLVGAGDRGRPLPWVRNGLQGLHPPVELVTWAGERDLRRFEFPSCGVGLDGNVLRLPRPRPTNPEGYSLRGRLVKVQCREFHDELPRPVRVPRRFARARSRSRPDGVHSGERGRGRALGVRTREGEEGNWGFDFLRCCLKAGLAGDILCLSRGKGREGKGREGKGREGGLLNFPHWLKTPVPRFLTLLARVRPFGRGTSSPSCLEFST